MQKGFVDALSRSAIHLLIESGLEPLDLLRAQVALPLVIRPLYLHFINRIPVYAGFLASDRGGLLIMWCMTLKWRTAVPGHKPFASVRPWYQR
jgi:hypothetical protein